MIHSAVDFKQDIYSINVAMMGHDTARPTAITLSASSPFTTVLGKVMVPCRLIVYNCPRKGMPTIACYDGVNCSGGNKILLEDGGSGMFFDFGKNNGVEGSERAIFPNSDELMDSFSLELRPGANLGHCWGDFGGSVGRVEAS